MKLAGATREEGKGGSSRRFWGNKLIIIHSESAKEKNIIYDKMRLFDRFGAGYITLISSSRRSTIEKVLEVGKLVGISGIFFFPLPLLPYTFSNPHSSYATVLSLRL